MIDSLRADPARKDDTLLSFVCEVFVKWTELPSAVKKVVEGWDSLPEELQKGVEMYLARAWPQFVGV